jgi:hypothetical protein
MERRRWNDDLAARSPKETLDDCDDDDDDEALAGGEISVKSGVVMLQEVVCQSNRIASKAGYRF